MSKKVLKQLETVNLSNRVFLSPPKFEKPVLEVEEYEGPTIEEIEEQNRKMIREAEEKAEEIIRNAKAEAEDIVKEAEAGAFEYIKKSTEDAKKVDEEARTKAEKYRIAREEEVNKISNEQKQNMAKEFEDIRNNAYKEGYENGYAEGKREADRLIKRLHVIIQEAIDRRDSIIEDAEDQVIRIILLIAYKVVKSISQEQKGVVIDNIKAALQKIKGKTEVVVRVNTEDLELTTDHKESILQQFEELQNVTILEDMRIDKGGCIIETDFGSVDARIATQLQEIEDKIRELANISYFKMSGVVNPKAQKPAAEQPVNTL